jgi:TolB-like protein/tetratricopeptide (TPR) repeat protein
MPSKETESTTEASGPPSGLRLDSWKEIASYLKRSPRTVRRWERREGLPAHRHHHAKKGTIYAFPHELDAWLDGRSVATGRDRSPLGLGPQLSQPPRSEKVQRVRPIVLAVLPLRNLSSDPEQERFADGLTEEIILDIGQCCPSRLRVIAMTSVMQYKQSPKGIGEIGRELRVDYILEGGIRRYGRRVRLTARLIAARDQAYVWTDTYEIQLPPVFSFQQTMARQVVESLAGERRLTPCRRLHPAIPESAAAHEAYIEGRSFFHTTDGEIMKKIERLNLAIERDPKFARSYAELALVYFPRLFRDYPPIVTFGRIRELSAKALMLDSKLARGHAMQAASSLFGAWNWAEADRSSRRAINLNPSDPWGRIIRAAYRVVVGEPEGAIEELEQGCRLSPQSADLSYWFVVLAFFARNYDWAIERCQEMLRLDASLGVAHALLGGCYAQKGEYALALNHCEKARELDNGPMVGTARACSTYALAGERETAQRLLQNMVEAKEKEYVRDIFLAQASVGLGNDQQTLDWLEEAYELHEPILIFLKADPRFDALSALPRFRKLLRRVGL